LVRVIERSVKKRGVARTIVHSVVAVVKRALGRHESEFAASDAAEGRAFDAQFGVSTGGEIAQTELDDVADVSWIHGSAYVASSKIDLAALLAPFGLGYEDATFVDLGAGKGRVLLMAAALPFTAIVGVEYSSALAACARDNVRRYTGPKLCESITVETMDAAHYRLPSGPMVLFMYHPFDETIMKRVVASAEASLRDDPRRVLVVYFKPVHRAPWDASRSFVLRHQTELYAVYESRSA